MDLLWRLSSKLVLDQEIKNEIMKTLVLSVRVVSALVRRMSKDEKRRCPNITSLD